MWVEQGLKALLLGAFFVVSREGVSQMSQSQNFGKIEC